MVTVFLSSTSTDLIECRNAVYRAIEGLSGYHCARMEDFGSWTLHPLELCRTKVVECDLFLGLIGPLYGSTMTDGRSFTELEYATATAAQRPRLIFLTTDDYPIGANTIEPTNKRRKQEQFRSALRRELVVESFSNAAELCAKVVAAIRNWEAATGGPSLDNSLIRIRRQGPPQQGWREFRKAFIRLGRDPLSDVEIVDDDGVSWEHGCIMRVGDVFVYRHISKTNDTRIHGSCGERVLQPDEAAEVKLSQGDRLTIGDTTLEVEFKVRADNRPRVETRRKPAT
jgi:hypothetical protein